MISKSTETGLQLKDKIALVTGAGQGIGEEISYEFSRQGAKLVVVDINVKRGLQVVKNIKEHGNDAIYIEVDATKNDLVEKCVSTVLKTYKTVDILVNCIGYNEFMSIEDVTTEKFDDLIKLNLHSQWNFCKALISTMKKNKYGKIINLASGAGVSGIPKALPYTTAKHAIVGLTRALAVDLGPFNINVNCIVPGSVLVPQLYKTVSKNFLEKIIDSYPLQRLGKASDIAKAALFLASSSSDWITGVVLPVDGGITCCLRAKHIE